MIDHIGILVTNLDASVTFYTKALAPLGYALVMKGDGFAGLGIGSKGTLWLGVGAPTDRQHIAFRAPGRTEVRAFHAAGVAAGGSDNGPPGVREAYHPNYYGAFVRDPDGHNIEAVCHEAYLGG
jgi:catechol 2,3-dioxygenase-like lactoylglutathione lyase family enzyme